MPPEGPAFVHTQLCAKTSLRISRMLVESMACRLNQRASIIIRGQHLAGSLDRISRNDHLQALVILRRPLTAGLSKANMTMSDNSPNGYNGNTASPSYSGTVPCRILGRARYPPSARHPQTIPRPPLTVGMSKTNMTM